MDVIRPCGHLIGVLAGANSSINLNLGKEDEDDVEKVIVLQTHVAMLKLFFHVDKLINVVNRPFFF